MNRVKQPLYDFLTQKTVNKNNVFLKWGGLREVEFVHF